MRSEAVPVRRHGGGAGWLTVERLQGVGGGGEPIAGDGPHGRETGLSMFSIWAPLFPSHPINFYARPVVQLAKVPLGCGEWRQETARIPDPRIKCLCVLPR